MKNITFEYIHINKILNFILKVFFQGISKENQHYKLPTDLLNSVQGKLGNPIAGLHNQIIPHPSNGLGAYSCQACAEQEGHKADEVSVILEFTFYLRKQTIKKEMNPLYIAANAMKEGRGFWSDMEST